MNPELKLENLENEDMAEAGQASENLDEGEDNQEEYQTEEPEEEPEEEEAPEEEEQPSSPDVLSVMQEMMKMMRGQQQRVPEQPKTPSPEEEEELKNRFFDDPVGTTAQVVMRMMQTLESEKAKTKNHIFEQYRQEIERMGYSPMNVNPVVLNDMAGRVVAGAATARECALELVSQHLASVTASKRRRKTTKAQKKAAAETVAPSGAEKPTKPKKGKKEIDWHQAIFGAK